MKIFILIFIFITTIVSSGHSTFCKNLTERAKRHGIHIDGTSNIYKINSKKAISLYSAPNKNCPIIDKKTSQDKSINVYIEYDGFISVMFFEEDGEQQTGWIEKQILTEKNTDSGPNYDFLSNTH